jgi:hypothetical protein
MPVNQDLLFCVVEIATVGEVQDLSTLAKDTIYYLQYSQGHRMNLVKFLLVFLQLAQPAGQPLDRIRAKTPFDPETNLTSLQIAGQYANPSKELIKLIGPPLSGNNLYIFPDNTYIFCEWADIMQNTIYDKGIWSLSDNVIEFKSDSEIRWNPELERKFLVLHRASHPKEILLVGIASGLSYFEKGAGNDPEAMLLIVGKQREKKISQTEVAELKTRLMREAWRPTFFRNQP